MGNETGLAATAAPLGIQGLRFKLSVMMFLEFFIWGSWLPLIFDYLPRLGFTTGEQTWILNAFALASFTAMFFSTQFADRNFSAERFMSFSHLVGGLAILGLFFLQAPLGTASHQFNAAVIEAKGASDTQAIGQLPDGTKVLVKNVDIKWDKFAKLDKDKRPTVYFLITGKLTQDDNTLLLADAKAPRRRSGPSSCSCSSIRCFTCRRSPFPIRSPSPTSRMRKRISA